LFFLSFSIPLALILPELVKIPDSKCVFRRGGRSHNYYGLIRGKLWATVDFFTGQEIDAHRFAGESMILADYPHSKI
jgi:hypothetical protein